MAICLLHLGKAEEATALFRDVANSRGDEKLAGYAQWQLELLRWQRDVQEKAPRAAASADWRWRKNYDRAGRSSGATAWCKPTGSNCGFTTRRCRTDGTPAASARQPLGRRAGCRF